MVIKFNIPPAVIRFTSHSKTTLEPLLTCKNDKHGKIITIAKQASGKPDLVVYLKNRGARPSIARVCRLRVAQYVYAFPALKMDVHSSALTTCGSPSIERFVIAITYGEAAAVPAPARSPLSTAVKVGSL